VLGLDIESLSDVSPERRPSLEGEKCQLLKCQCSMHSTFRISTSGHVYTRFPSDRSIGDRGQLSELNAVSLTSLVNPETNRRSYSESAVRITHLTLVKEISAPSRNAQEPLRCYSLHRDQGFCSKMKSARQVTWLRRALSLCKGARRIPPAPTVEPSLVLGEIASFSNNGVQRITYMTVRFNHLRYGFASHNWFDR
jgi:hypothetical protein